MDNAATLIRKAEEKYPETLRQGTSDMESAEAARLRVKYDDDAYEDSARPGIKMATEQELRDRPGSDPLAT